MRQIIGKQARVEGDGAFGHVGFRHQQQLSRLEQAHQSLETELAALTRRSHLTPSEEARARAIKKQKLQTKDKMRVLMSRAVIE